jgi:protein-tyrosine phosphatase
MLDIHCHILPGVDDGARSLEQSLQMLAAAREAGVTAIMCTPHCRAPYFDYDKMTAAFTRLQAAAGGFPLAMGFEVNVNALRSLGLGWLDRLRLGGGSQILLELEDRADEIAFRGYKRLVYDIQCRGYDVIVAHPERYQAIQKRPELASELVKMRCELQASADFMGGGRARGLAGVFDRQRVKRCAKTLFERGLYAYIASDAHCPEHYSALQSAVSMYGSCLRPRS